MASSEARELHQIRMAPFHAAFCADDTLVSIVPLFDYSENIPLLSCDAKVGPFKAGIMMDVPLWLASLLHQRSLCQMHIPEFLELENLSRICRYERTNASLSTELPFYYREIAQRYIASSSALLPKSSALLLQDIAQIRLDKLRQQFQEIASNGKDNPSQLLEVEGISSTELTQLKPFILQALNDHVFLSSSYKDISTGKKLTEPVDDISTTDDVAAKTLDSNLAVHAESDEENVSVNLPGGRRKLRRLQRTAPENQ